MLKILVNIDKKTYAGTVRAIYGGKIVYEVRFNFLQLTCSFTEGWGNFDRLAKAIQNALLKKGINFNIENVKRLMKEAYKPIHRSIKSQMAVYGLA